MLSLLLKKKNDFELTSSFCESLVGQLLKFVRSTQQPINRICGSLHMHILLFQSFIVPQWGVDLQSIISSRKLNRYKF